MGLAAGMAMRDTGGNEGCGGCWCGGGKDRGLVCSGGGEGGNAGQYERLGGRGLAEMDACWIWCEIWEARVRNRFPSGF